MFNWLRRRRLSADAQKKLMIFAARAEEEIIEAHVGNLMDLMDTLGDEIDLDTAIDMYVNRIMSLEETLAATVTTRLLAQIENPGNAAAKGRFRNVFKEPRRER